MNFLEATAYLDSLQLHKIKLGLGAMESFLDKVSRPDRQLRFVHVAGTNGKGSVSVNILTILARAGHRVGLFTSPHLSSVRERFRINDSYITEKKFAEHASHVREVLGEEKITYFEFTTAVALLWFAEAGVDLVVLETGLGGRLDATNVVVPLVSIITNISMDHEAYLGNDLRSIATEKAGIIKRGVPVVTGVMGGVSLEVVDSRCRELGAPLYRFGREFGTQDNGEESWNWQSKDCLAGGVYRDLRCGIKGDYQKANSSLAICCLNILKTKGFQFSESDVCDGLQQVRWPGRLEYFELEKKTHRLIQSGQQLKSGVVRFLIDGAHNPAGVDSLVNTLSDLYHYTKLIVVWGAMEDKDLSSTMPAISGMASIIILTKPQGERAADPEALLKVVPEKDRPRCRVIPSVQEAVELAEELADEGALIVIAGSLYLIGEVRGSLVGELVQ